MFGKICFEDLGYMHSTDRIGMPLSEVLFCLYLVGDSLPTPDLAWLTSTTRRPRILNHKSRTLNLKPSTPNLVASREIKVLIFVVELCLLFISSGCRAFFCGPDRSWNIFVTQPFFGQRGCGLTV